MGGDNIMNCGKNTLFDSPSREKGRKHIGLQEE